MKTRQDRLKPLRRDVHLLGEILGQMLNRLGTEGLLGEVEAIRELAKRVRRGAQSIRSLEMESRDLPAQKGYEIAKAFTEFLRLANVAEQQHRIRRRGFYESQSAQPQPGSLEAALKGVKPSQKNAAQQVLSQMKIDLVLTAHPTETQKRSAIRRYKRIASILGELERVDLSKWKKIELRQELQRHIQGLWLTEIVPDKKPTPLAEARFGTSVVEEVLWEALPETYRKLDHYCQRYLGADLPLEATPLVFSSWIGGDRDGNPFVTAGVTRQVLVQSMKQALNLYESELKKLVEEFSFSQASSKLWAKVKRQTKTQPYRHIFLQLIESIRLTREFLYTAPASLKDLPKGALKHESELLGPLCLCYESLIEVGAFELAKGPLLDLIRRIKSFGLVLLPLDVRQSAEVHSEAVADVADKLFQVDYRGQSEAERQSFLLAQLKSSSQGPSAPDWRALASQLQPMTLEVLETCELLREFPQGSFRSYIVAMADQASHVLEVHWLLNLAGVEKFSQVAPLLETPESLARADAMMSELFQIKDYRKLIQGRQQIMLGYSDSAKRSGRLHSAWTLYQVQKSLDALGKEFGIEVEYFHGRGGSIGRGGGPIHLALMSQPRGVGSARLRVTEQGESIEAKFGLPEIAGRTMELYLSGVLESQLTKEKVEKSSWCQVMQEMARDSAQEFKQRIYEDKDFLSHYQQITPIEELGLLKIGSRPKKRKKDLSLESLRAIPWVFAWTQNRCLLPSWLGVGEALSEQIRQGRLDLLREMYGSWPFFRATLDLVEMVLAKADPAIVRYYSKTLVDPSLQRQTEQYLQSYRKSVKALLSVTARPHLLASNPVLKRSIDLRTPYVDVLNVIQAQLLKTFREGREKGIAQNPQLERSLALTISGISAGMRNTG